MEELYDAGAVFSSVKTIQNVSYLVGESGCRLTTLRIDVFSVMHYWSCQPTRAILFALSFDAKNIDLHCVLSLSSLQAGSVASPAGSGSRYACLARAPPRMDVVGAPCRKIEAYQHYLLGSARQQRQSGSVSIVFSVLVCVFTTKLVQESFFSSVPNTWIFQL